MEKKAISKKQKKKEAKSKSPKNKKKKQKGKTEKIKKKRTLFWPNFIRACCAVSLCYYEFC